MSCPEVVYQAYYPYLYQRSTTTASGVTRTNPFPAFSHQYDRFNMQRTLEQHQQSYTLAESSNQPHGSSSHHSHSSAASVSSGGGMGSPVSPALRHKEEDQPAAGRSSGEGGGGGVADDDDDDDEGSSTGSRAQYVSANCVVFTHYSGDVAAVVDEHFNRALSYAENKGSGAPINLGKEPSPMSTRNFPPSFWNSNYQTTATVTSHHATDIYSDPYHSSASAASDPWHSHYQQFSAAAHHHHRAVHEYHHHHHNMAQYGGLLLPPATRLPPHVTASHQYTKGSMSHEPWGSAASHSAAHHSHAHALDTPGYSTFSSMAGFTRKPRSHSETMHGYSPHQSPQSGSEVDPPHSYTGQYLQSHHL